MCCSERLFLRCRQLAVMYLFDVEYTVRAEFSARLPENTIVLSRDIHLRRLLYLLHTFAGDIAGASEHLPSSLSILFSLFSQSLLSSVFPPTCPSLYFLPFSKRTPPPTRRRTHALSLPPSLSPSLSVPSPLSVSLCCALMNYLPLPVNSTDNPGEAVKDHRSAPQTGPQATAEEQHANNKPLHLAL